MGKEIAFENGRISDFQGFVTFTLTLDRVILHTVMRHSSTSTYIPNFIEIKTFCRWTDRCTDVRKSDVHGTNRRMDIWDATDTTLERRPVMKQVSEIIWVAKRCITILSPLTPAYGFIILILTPHLIHGSLNSQQSASWTASPSVQPFSHSSAECPTQTDRHTDQDTCYISSKRPHVIVTD